ncbi:hypothetical protein [Cyclobacterium jeungdonense]|uniref:hypothetical protein n=1 Tax=Cyclobacterium jeungdonense TaxID=708087 RepID=UPI0013D57BF8|nr:hypothetical protein [Cyclobacterium jeungdonense]
MAGLKRLAILHLSGCSLFHEPIIEAPIIFDNMSTEKPSGQAGTKPGVREDGGGKDFCALIFWYFWI